MSAVLDHGLGEFVFVLKVNMFVGHAICGYCSLCLNLGGCSTTKNKGVGLISCKMMVMGIV